MNTIVLSDLHIGSRYFISGPLKGFFAGLPEDTELVLNGDTVDRRRFRMSPLQKDALDLIRQESLRRRVVWVWGNHDWKYMLPDPAEITFVRNYSVGKRLFVSHGHGFDFITAPIKPLIFLIRVLHDYRVDRGADHVHVAFAAKKYSGLYRVLRSHITASAVRFARKNGYEAVACGHTHYVEDAIVDGIRYINTGSWTEPPVTFLLVNDKEIVLQKIH